MKTIKAVPLSEIYKIIADIHNDHVGTDTDDHLPTIHEIEERLEEKAVDVTIP